MRHYSGLSTENHFDFFLHTALHYCISEFEDDNIHSRPMVFYVSIHKHIQYLKRAEVLVDDASKTCCFFLPCCYQAGATSIWKLFSLISTPKHTLQNTILLPTDALQLHLSDKKQNNMNQHEK